MPVGVVSPTDEPLGEERKELVVAVPGEKLAPPEGSLDIHPVAEEEIQHVLTVDSQPAAIRQFVQRISKPTEVLIFARIADNPKQFSADSDGVLNLEHADTQAAKGDINDTAIPWAGSKRRGTLNRPQGVPEKPLPFTGLT